MDRFYWCSTLFTKNCEDIRLVFEYQTAEVLLQFFASWSISFSFCFFFFFPLLMLESVISLSTSGISDAVVMVRLAHFLTPPSSGLTGRLRWSWVYCLFHLAHLLWQAPQTAGMCGGPRDIPSGMGRDRRYSIPLVILWPTHDQRFCTSHFHIRLKENPLESCDYLGNWT